MENKLIELKVLDRINSTRKILESSHGKKTKKRSLQEDESTSEKSFSLSSPATLTDLPETDSDVVSPYLCPLNDSERALNVAKACLSVHHTCTKIIS